MSLLIQLPMNRNVQIARVFLHSFAPQRSPHHISVAAPHLLLEIEHRLLPMRLFAKRRRAELHAAREKDIEIPHESVHILRVLHVQLERRSEVQIFFLDRVDVQVLLSKIPKIATKMQHESVMGCVSGTTSTRGSNNAICLIVFILKPYTSSQTNIKNNKWTYNRSSRGGRIRLQCLTALISRDLGRSNHLLSTINQSTVTKQATCL